MYKLEMLGKLKPFQIEKEVVYNDNKDVCLVYSLWSHPEYVNSCFYSILSQLCYTDIEQYNIVVFVHDVIESYARKVLKNLIPPENIVVLKGEECAKQRVCTHSILSKYEYIVISDADNFVISKNRGKGLKPYYNSFSLEHHQGVTFLQKFTGGLKTLKERKELTNFKNEEEYGKFFKELKKQLLFNDFWYLAGYMSYPNSLVKELTATIEECIPYNIFCDETVWIKFLLCDSKKRIAISTYDEKEEFKFINPGNITDLEDMKEGVLYLVHPFLSNYKSPLQQKIIDIIIKDFYEK
jgi:hypothetical protein